MDKRDFAGVPVPVYGQGTWKFRGGPEALRAGIDLGLTHIDTAELYSGAEEIVGKAIEGRREEVFLVSKVMPQNASRKGTVKACETSLRKLSTDRLDCYLLHWPGSHPLEDTIAGFEELREAGKIRAYGVSNFDEDLLREAAGIAGKGKIACNQVLYNLEERHIEAKVLPVCRELGVALVGYSPFDGATEDGVVAEVAREHGATPRQVALAFLTRLDGTFAIPKAEQVAHVRENAVRLTLTAAQVARLEKAYPLRVRKELPTA
ncbi:MAG TPA: aldo/keto reductase [Myxococcales bacterium]|jgi:diketogulonate reductase-like aldo/keto reductase